MNFWRVVPGDFSLFSLVCSCCAPLPLVKRKNLFKTKKFATIFYRKRQKQFTKENITTSRKFFRLFLLLHIYAYEESDDDVQHTERKKRFFFLHSEEWAAPHDRIRLGIFLVVKMRSFRNLKSNQQTEQAKKREAHGRSLRTVRIKTV